MNLFRPLLVVAMVFPACTALAQEDISKVNGNIQAHAGTTYGDLDTVNGDIEIGDDVTVDEISTVNGAIRAGQRLKLHQAQTVNGNITLGRQASVNGGLQTVNGGVFVDHGSTVTGDIETVNGGIGLVGTRLKGSIQTINGDITVGIGSHVSGDVQVRKPNFNFSLSAPRTPRVIIGPGAVVAGKLQFERDVKLFVHTTATIGTVTGATLQRYSSNTAPTE